MKTSALAKLAALGSIAALSLTGCAANEAAQSDKASESSLSGTLQGAGATSQDAAQGAWIAGFQTANSAVTINYDPTGSGAGRETFQKGASQFAGSDRAFKSEELSGEFATCKSNSIVEIPAYISPIAVVFNLGDIKELNMSATTIAKIFAGQITSWDDPEIAAENKDKKLPNLPIKPVHRSDKSGTTGNFTDYLAAAAADSWTAGSVEEWPSELGGEAAQGTSGVVQAVTNGEGMIGYVDASKAGDLGSVAVRVGEEYVAHSAKGAAAVVDASPLEEGRNASDLAVKLDRTSTEKGVYPIVLISYLIGCEEYKDAAQGKLVQEYFKYVVSADGQEAAAKDAGSAPISDTLREKALEAISAIK